MRPLPFLALLAGLAGAAAADDKPPPLPTLPKFTGYSLLPDPVRGKVKSAKGDTVTVLVPEYSLSGGRSYGRRGRPPQVKEKDVEHTLALHPDALVRWSRKPERTDDKGRRKEYTPAEMKLLQAPAGAPGYLGDKLELAADQLVEMTLLTPTKVRPEELTPQDYRVKWLVIQGAPPDPKDVAKRATDDAAKKGKK